MLLFVANTTNQMVDFSYRMPDGQPRMQRIEIGGQIRVADDRLTQDDVDKILAQHFKYGLVPSREVSRTEPFIGLCYSVGTPVDIDDIAQAFDHNHGVLTEQGREIRKEAAIAVSNIIEERAPNIELKAFEVSVVEQETKKNPSPSFSEGTRVTREAPDSRDHRRQRRG